ncbi:hypothetical protein [Raineya orbicola]|nr:hypothetical protein [Raineya orbicola]
MKVLTQKSELQENIGKDVILEGIMQMQKFQNKAGRIFEFYEFWLQMADGTRVLLRNNMGHPLSKEPFTRKVHLKGKLFYGNIDSEDGKAQSRLGYRLDFTEWKIVER